MEKSVDDLFARCFKLDDSDPISIKDLAKDLLMSDTDSTLTYLELNDLGSLEIGESIKFRSMTAERIS
ncbi:hypothetical protein [Mucilaginibacter pallidiroseus]|uniref:hypothetical protein n=1 Tax=Mucilaginibacter pallidiroseus TaxID=2599295 RepID=UPI0011B82A96|nr:hypothetical protein [Mucilaginibacter pallidiroseus]